MRVSGKRAFQVEGMASAKALRWEWANPTAKQHREQCGQIEYMTEGDLGRKQRT